MSYRQRPGGGNYLICITARDLLAWVLALYVLPRDALLCYLPENERQLYTVRRAPTPKLELTWHEHWRQHSVPHYAYRYLPLLFPTTPTFLRGQHTPQLLTWHERALRASLCILLFTTSLSNHAYCVLLGYYPTACFLYTTGPTPKYTTCLLFGYPIDLKIGFAPRPFWGRELNAPHLPKPRTGWMPPPFWQHRIKVVPTRLR